MLQQQDKLLSKPSKHITIKYRDVHKKRGAQKGSSTKIVASIG